MSNMYGKEYEKLEAVLEATRVDIKKLETKLTRTINKMKKIEVEYHSQQVENFWNETDPRNVDWKFVTSDAAGTPRAVDYSRYNKKVAELFGYDSEYFVEVGRYRDYRGKIDYLALSAYLTADGSHDKKFKNAVAVAIDCFDRLDKNAAKQYNDGWGYGDLKDIDYTGYVHIGITTDDLSESGITQVMVNPETGECIFGMIRYSSWRSEHKTANIDDMIVWLRQNGHTYN